MSHDVQIHGIPRAITAAEVAAMLVQWCGVEIATLHTEPVLHVALRGVTAEQITDPCRDSRAIEVYRPRRGEMWLTTRHADAFTRSIASGFGAWYAARFGVRGKGRAVCSATGEVIRG